MIENFAMKLFGISLGVTLLVAFILALILVFEIWMFVDAFRNPHISDERRMLWLIGMILVHPIVAIVYFFTDRQPPIARD